MRPKTLYTKNGHINIAYQVFGSGNTDLVYIPGWVSNVDLMWACPELVGFLKELAKFCRIILFDKRGTGLSDRIVELSTLEERMDDIGAVMDDVGSQKAILFGHSEGGSVSALFAATYPNRTISLITFGIFAKRKYSEDYPWAPTTTERQLVYDMIENNWGSGEMNLESLAPSKANDKVFMAWLADYFRSGASPSAALVLTKMNTEVDIVAILGSIKVPTLIMQRTHDIDVKIEEGRFIAQRIQGAKFVELEGNDHLFWVGDTVKVLQEMKTFILNTKSQINHKEQLFTIVAAKISSSYSPANLTTIIEQFVTQYRGNIVQCNNHEFIANFEGPNKAVHCCLDMMDALKAMSIQLAVCIYIKAGTLEEGHFTTSDSDNLMETILQHTKKDQILITQTVKNLLSGAGLSTIPYKTIPESLSGTAVLLYAITDQLQRTVKSERSLRQIPQHDSFLENILQSIHTHLGNDSFNVDVLSKEVGISERQLQRKLKAVTNKSPVQLIASVRLHRAKELLLENRFTIAEIAYETGFSNPSYFSKSFKKEFGATPSAMVQS